MNIVVTFLTWYVVIQLLNVAALPLAMRFFAGLADRGYAFSKILGVVLVGLVLWLGTSYGLLRNEAGGAWLALAVVAGVSYGFGGRHVVSNWLRRGARQTWRTVLGTEILFLVAFALWTWVRANDPAVNHTEEPMDLMFMNSIWTSPLFPPRDAWLSGYSISYYYFGYWLLNTLGHLAGIEPATAYTVGQASWYGLLLTGAFGVAYNLAALQHTDGVQAPSRKPEASRRASIAHGATGVLAALFVGVIGNLQVILEWLYANGARLDRLAAWVDVNGFPENAQRSGLWYIGYDWWWWRSSRVISDRDLSGGHLEVIDEFPMFSYILGDNHPHVLAMPVVLLVIAMALAVYLAAQRVAMPQEPGAGVRHEAALLWKLVRSALPMGAAGFVLIVAVSGGLAFLNTWDYPPYWLLLTLSLFAGLVTSEHRTSPRRFTVVTAAIAAVAFGGALALGTFALYLPYFLTAQSQAGGFVPNLFNPTRVQQMLLMFGVFVPALAGWLLTLWRVIRPTLRQAAATAGVVYGLPAALLACATAIALGTQWGQEQLRQVHLPGGSAGYARFILERWTQQPYAFLLVGALLAGAAALAWRILHAEAPAGQAARTDLFVLMLAAIGLTLVYVPEFLFLRDNFGTRMNTVFKFYYQAWLLLGLTAAYAVGGGLFSSGNPANRSAPALARALFAMTLALGAMVLLYPMAGTYSKTLGFSAQPRTLDATHFLARESPAERAAVDWVLYNTSPNAIVLEGKGASYQSAYNRVSMMTGRSTLLGWDGHESQWRGDAFGEMARGRAEALDTVYRTGSPTEIEQVLGQWGIDYVYIGPTERQQYGLTPRSEERIAAAMDLVFEDGDVRIYRRRHS